MAAGAFAGIAVSLSSKIQEVRNKWLMVRTGTFGDVSDRLAEGKRKCWEGMQ